MKAHAIDKIGADLERGYARQPHWSWNGASARRQTARNIRAIRRRQEQHEVFRGIAIFMMTTGQKPVIVNTPTGSPRKALRPAQVSIDDLL